MSSKYQYSQINESGIVTNEAASLELVANPGSARYIKMEKFAISVYEAAQGGGGTLEIKDTLGNTIYKMNVDGIKDFSIDFGDEGREVGPGVGLQAQVANAATKQASVSVAVIGHTTFFATNE